MRPEVLNVVREWYPKYLADQKYVLEIGALDVNGSPRSIFTEDHVYVGVDMREGDGVDVVANSHDLKQFLSGSRDVVVCIDMLEHDDAFWLTLAEIKRVLRVSGYFVCSVPTINFTTYHGHPDDYWRFTYSAFFDILLDPSSYALIEHREIATHEQVDTLIGIAQKR